MGESLMEIREIRKSGKPLQNWVGGTYEDSAVILMVGNEHFAGFSGKTGTSGQSLTKLRKGLPEAKLIWGLNKVRDYVRRLKDRGFCAKAYRIVVVTQIELIG